MILRLVFAIVWLKGNDTKFHPTRSAVMLAWFGGVVTVKMVDVPDVKIWVDELTKSWPYSVPVMWVVYVIVYRMVRSAVIV